jgi:serine/threonine-protein kinase
MTTTIRIESSPETPAAVLARATGLLRSVVAKRYRLDAVLEARAWGGIYRAEHLELATWVAVKVAYSDAPAADLARLEREAVAGAQVRHPNLCLVSDAGKLREGGRYLAMELVPGTTLRDVLRSGPLPMTRALRIARQLLAAAHALHRHGFIHAGIHPGNILLGGESGTDAKLVDFGRARAHAAIGAAAPSEPAARAPARLAALAAQMPPPVIAYSSPEEQLGQGLDERADLYSIGVVLYEMIGGSRPFREDDAQPFAESRDVVPRIHLAEGDIPDALHRCVERLLAVDRNARYTTATAALAALEAAEATPAAPDAREPPKRSVPPPSARSEPPSPPRLVPSTRPKLLEAPPLSAADRVIEAAEQRWGAARSWLGTVPKTLERSGLPAWALAGTAVGLIVIVAVVAVLLRGPSEESMASSSPTESAKSEAQTAETVQVTPVAAAPGSAGVATRTSDGPDVTAAKKQLVAAVDSQNWARAGKTIDKLAERGEEPFRDAKVIGAVISTAIALEHAAGPAADALFETLKSRLGTRGLEILFEIARTKGGTKGAKRAAAILDEPDVVARQPAQLRIVRDLSRAKCEDKPALFDRAADEGDERALTALLVLRESDCPRRPKNHPCCFYDNAALAAAIKRMRHRLGKPAPRADDD